MDNLGIVYETSEKYVVIFTPEGKFLLVKRRMDMTLGQQVSFSDDEIYAPENETFENTFFNSNYKKLIGIDKIKKISLLVASILMIFLAIQVFIFQSRLVADNFAYIDVDINPSIEFTIDKSYNVIDVKALNKDAKIYISSLKLKGLGFYESLGLLYDECLNNGIINENGNEEILISGSLNVSSEAYKKNKENLEKKLNDTLISVKHQFEKVKGNNVHLTLVKVSPIIREEALKNKISMGRYKIYLESYKKGVEMSINQAADESVDVLLNSIKLLDISDDLNPSNSYPKIATTTSISTPTKLPLNTALHTITSASATPNSKVSSFLLHAKTTKEKSHTPVAIRTIPNQTPRLPNILTSIQPKVTPQVSNPTSIHKRNNITSGKTYKIINKLSNKCIEVYVWSTDDGGRLAQWDYVPPRGNQHWIITEVEGGFYKIINQHSNKAMDVKASSKDLGAIVQQSTYTGANSQLWSIIDTGEGFCKIVNKNSKKCLDVCDFSKCDGANIIQWDFRDTNNDNQLFKIITIN